jgi:hypothetical protein
MWRPETPALTHGRLIEELRVRVDELRQAATARETRAAEALRQWATELEIEMHSLVMRSWMAR